MTGFQVSFTLSLTLSLFFFNLFLMAALRRSFIWDKSFNLQVWFVLWFFAFKSLLERGEKERKKCRFNRLLRTPLFLHLIWSTFFSLIVPFLRIIQIIIFLENGFFMLQSRILSVSMSSSLFLFIFGCPAYLMFLCDVILDTRPTSLVIKAYVEVYNSLESSCSQVLSR